MQENTHHWSDTANYYLTGDGVLYLFPLPKKDSIEIYDGKGGLTQKEMKQAVRKIVVSKGFKATGNYSTFADYSNLTSVTLPVGFADIGQFAFNKCAALKHITLPDTLTEIGACAFAYSGLAEISIPNSVTSIGQESFYHCESLTTVSYRYVKPFVDNGKTHSIYQYSFQNCHALRSVELPESINSISKQVFDCCEKLISVSIPSSVSKIDTPQFSQCNNLTTIIYGGTQEAWDKMIDKNHIPATATVICTGKGIAQTGAAEDLESAENAADEAVPEEIAETSVTNDENSEVDPESTIASDKTDLATTGDTTVNNDENTVTRDHLVPGTQALFIIVSGTEDNYSFDTESLLYIDQKTVDENGTVSFSAPPTAAADSKVSVIYGQCAHEAGDPSTLNGDSAAVIYCKHCGEAISILPPGDIDGDGEVTIIDATYIQRYCVKIPIPIPEEYVMRGDINRDGELNVIDATWIQRLEAGLYVAN